MAEQDFGSELAEMIHQFEVRRANDSHALSNTPLPPASRPGRAAFVAQLVSLDMAFAWRAGRPKPLVDYLIDYPELMAHPEALAELAGEEFRLRLDAGQSPDPAEYERRYGVAIDPDRRPTPEVGEATVPMPRELAPPAGLTQFPEPGETFGEFQILSEIGRGSFARVYLAEQLGLANRLVALKVTAVPSLESQTLAQLQHPNIVPVYSVHDAGQLYAICMPYYGTTTLANVIGSLSDSPHLPGSGQYFVSVVTSQVPPSTQSRALAPLAGPPPPADVRTFPPDDTLVRLAKASYVEAVAWLVARIADGLSHAHSRGIVHRDLKPANVLLTNDGQPMILDFNLSESVQHSPTAGGTLPYMAPEHLLAYQRDPRGRVDERSDIYALGLMAFELLTGRPAFETPGSRVAVAVPQMIAMRRAGAPSVTRYNPSVSPAVAAIVATCLAPDPKDRYQTALALKQDLEAHLAHRTLSIAPNPSPAENVKKWVRRHPNLSSVLSIAAISAIALTVLAVMLGVTSGRANRLTYSAQVERLLADRDQFEMEFGAGVDNDPEWRVGLRAGAELLETYHVLGDPDWQSRKAFRDLPPGEQEQVRLALRSVLFLTHRAAACLEVPDLALLAAWMETLPAPAGDDAASQSARLCEEAIVLMDEEQYAEARELLDRAIELAPERRSVRFVRGVCLGQLGDHASAVQEFDICLTANAKNTVVLRYRATALQRLGQFDQAVETYTKLHELEPTNPAWLMERGYSKTAMRKNAEAIADLTEALRLGGAPSRCYLFRSRAYGALGEAREATADLAAFVRTQPTDAQDYYFRGQLRLKSNPERAVEDFRRALEINSRTDNAALALAGTLSEKFGGHQEAIEVVNKYLKRTSQQPVVQVPRAMFYAKLGQRTEALADVKEAMKNKLKIREQYMIAAVVAQTSRIASTDVQFSLALLRQILDIRPEFLNILVNDPDFDPIKNVPEYRALIARYQTPGPRGK